MNGTILRTASWGAAALISAALFSGPVLADGLPGRGKAAAAPAPETRPCSVSANVGLTTEYVFRGISQSNENAAVQGGVDLTCGRFYGGVWSSSIYADEATAEIDVYGGYRFATGPVNWDLGVIYYAYPGEPSYSSFGDYVELKAGASGQVWRGGTLGGTVFYAPDYNGSLGSTWTVEGSFSQALPKVGVFTPTFGATVGHSYIDRDNNDYTYWNVGLTLGFLERWSLDVRYWDTDGDGLADSFLADDRVVATVKYTF